MSKRRNHVAAFKTRLALEAVMGERMVSVLFWLSNPMRPSPSFRGGNSLRFIAD